MTSVVKVKVSGRLHTVDCSDATTLCRTYGDLRVVLERQGLVNADHVLVDSTDHEFDLEQNINLQASSVVYLRWMSFGIQVSDESVTLTLQVSQNQTIQQVKTAFQAESSQSVSTLSFNSVRLNDSMTLQHYEIAEGAKLVGRIKLTVCDINCELSVFVTVYEFTTIAELKQQYADSARRILSPGANISYRGTVLRDNQTIAECGLVDSATLHFENPSYEIVVADEEDESQVLIVVADHFTPAMVKEAYAKESREAVVSEDTLVFKEPLDESEMIYVAGVGAGAHLTLHREDQSRAIEYECGGCGGVVKLKRSEPVRCRSCGFRIVFKTRTTRTCQYIAR